MDRLTQVLGEDLYQLTTQTSDAELMLNRNVHRAVHAHHLGHWFAFRALHQKQIGGILSMSSGSAAALVASGAMTLENSCRFVMARMAAFEKVCVRLQGKYGSAIVIHEQSGDPVPFIREFPGLSVAFRCAPWKSVVAGSRLDIAALQTKAKENHWPLQVNDIPVEAPYHTEFFASCKPELRCCVEGINIRSPEIPLFLGASGKRETDPVEIKKFLVESADTPEAYSDALQAAYDHGLRNFLEIGHNPKTERYVADRIVDSSGNLAKDVQCWAVPTQLLISGSPIASGATI